MSHDLFYVGVIKFIGKRSDYPKGFVPQSITITDLPDGDRTDPIMAGLAGQELRKMIDNEIERVK